MATLKPSALTGLQSSDVLHLYHGLQLFTAVGQHPSALGKCYQPFFTLGTKDKLKGREGLQKKIQLRTWKQELEFPDSRTQAGSLPIPRLLPRGSNTCLKSTLIDLSCTTPRFTSPNAADVFLSNIVFTNCHPNYNMSQMCNYQHLNIYKS